MIMYTIDNDRNRIIFSYTENSLFEEIKKTSALKAQQIVTKEGVDMSDTFIVTDDERDYLHGWMNTIFPYITSSVPQQHLDTALSEDNVIITVYADQTRAISEGNIISADGVLRNLLIFGSLSEWYSSVAQMDFYQEYATKLSENIKLFVEILFDSRKRKVSTLFNPIAGSASNIRTFQQIIQDLTDALNALKERVTQAEEDINNAEANISINTDAISTNADKIAIDIINIAKNASDIQTLMSGLSAEIARATGAEESLARDIAAIIARTLYSLTIKVNGVTKGVYTPDKATTNIDIAVPTKVTDLNDAADYWDSTTIVNTINNAISGLVSSEALSTLLSAYATQVWVQEYVSQHQPSLTGYVDITSDQSITGKKTFAKATVTGALAIPTAPPSNPENGLVYLYFTEDGSYAE